MVDEVTRWKLRKWSGRGVMMGAVAAAGLALWRYGPEPAPPKRTPIEVPERPAPEPLVRKTTPRTPQTDPIDSGTDAVVADPLALVEALSAARTQPQRCSRAQGVLSPAPPLVQDDALADAAGQQLDYMVRADDWAHHTPANPAGASPTERAFAAGYRGEVVGEVIAWGQRTPDRAVHWWLGSRVHCRTLMDPEFHRVGVAVTEDPHSAGLAWVAVFGG